MPDIDLGNIFGQIANVTKDMVGKDVTSASAFAQEQMRLIEQNAILFSQMELAGEFTDDPERRDQYLQMIKATAVNFAKTIRALAVVEVEKLVNAVVKVVWDAIGTATGVALPIPGGLGGLAGLAGAIGGTRKP